MWDFDVHTHLSNQWTQNHKFDQHQEAYLLWIIVTSKFTHACSFVILTYPGWRDKSKRSCFLSISFYLRWKFSSAWHRVIIYSIRLFYSERKKNGLEEESYFLHLESPLTHQTGACFCNLWDRFLSGTWIRALHGFSLFLST